MRDLLPRAASTLARLSVRFVPDAFSIAVLLTLLTFGLATTLGGASFSAALRAWGGGVMSLLAFSMQMVLVVFSGYVVAVSPPVRRLLEAAAGLARSPRQAVAWTAGLSMLVCWLNWGVGLIAAAMLVRAMGRRHPGADYRLLVASAYLGMGTTWHAGPSGSVPLLLATPDSFMVRDGLVAAPVPLAETVFAAPNLVAMGIVLVVFVLLAAALQPKPENVAPPPAGALAALAPFEPPRLSAEATPADRLAHGGLLNRLVGVVGLASLALQARSGALALTLDSVNLFFLSLGVLLHPSAASLLKAAEEAARSVHGIVLQFPLYGGLYGLLKGTALAGLAANAFLAVASTVTFPFVVFVYSAALNYVVPSGGGKWALEAVYVLGAARALDVPAAAVAMAYAYGDMATNLVQPFWAIPLLALARLEFRDIFGYELVFFAVYAALAGGALLLVGLS